MKLKIRYKGVYFSDGTEYSVGDSVLLLYKRTNCLSGFVANVENYRGHPMRYAIHLSGTLYPKKRIRGIKMVLTEKNLGIVDLTKKRFSF